MFVLYDSNNIIRDETTMKTKNKRIRKEDQVIKALNEDIDRVINIVKNEHLFTTFKPKQIITIHYPYRFGVNVYTEKTKYYSEIEMLFNTHRYYGWLMICTMIAFVIGLLTANLL